jgi:hypothetical protein
MADERINPSGWLPPVAPGSRPAEPAAPPEPAPPPGRPTFARQGATQSAAPASAGNRQAVWALVLAVLALALLLISLGTFFLITLPCSIGALVLARRARTQVEDGVTPHGAGQAAAALWIARIGVITGVVAAVVFFALIAAGFDFEQFREDLERELEQRQDRDAAGVRTGIEGLRAVVGR